MNKVKTFSLLIALTVAGSAAAQGLNPYPPGVKPKNKSTPNDIGVAGAQGFGVGIYPTTLPSGFSAMTGTTNPASGNYGNYQYQDGSVMVYIPPFYYKIGTGSNGITLNNVSVKKYAAYASVSAANSDGYALHRAFYDGGSIKGFFVDKYLASNSGGTAKSIKNGIPLGAKAETGNSPFSGLTGLSTANDYYHGAITASKTRGSSFFVMTVFQAKALALLSLAHAQAPTSTTYNAWYDSGGTTNFPKGCSDNALGSPDDPTVKWEGTGYSTQCKTGSAGYGGGAGNLFAKSTHNGQNSGVADVNGTMWEIVLGVTSDGTNYYAFKTGTAAKNVTAGNSGSTDAWGASGLSALYDSLGSAIGAATASGNAYKFGSTSNKVLSESTSGNNWVATGAGIPQYADTTGATAYGKDGFWDARPNELCVAVGGGWSRGAEAGVWALNFLYSRSASNGTYGFRSALYP